MMRSSSALQRRVLGKTDDHSENGRLVVMMMAAFSARSAMTWKSSSAPASAKGHVAHLIQSDQVPFLPAGERAAELAVIAGFDEFVDERGNGSEANALVLTAGFDTEGRHQVRLAGTRFPQEDDGLSAFQIAAICKSAYLRNGDAGGVEIEFFDGLDLGQPGFRQPPGDPALLPLFNFGGEEGFEIADVGVSLAGGLFGDAAVLRRDGGDGRGDWKLFDRLPSIAHDLTPAQRSLMRVCLVKDIADSLPISIPIRRSSTFCRLLAR